MKRPAAAVESSVRTKKSGSSKSSAPRAVRSRKRRSQRANGRAAGKRCMAIIAMLKLDDAENVPKKLKDLVERIKAGLAAKGARHIDPETAASLLGKALRETGDALQNTVQELKAEVDNAEQGKTSRMEAVEAAAEHLRNQRQSVVDSTAALKQAAKELDAQHQVVKDSRAALKIAEDDAKKINDRRRRLELAERSAFKPLCEELADGSNGRKRLATLRRAGRNFGFHGELLSVASIVLKKKLEARRTFDNDVLRHITREFEKNSTSLEVAAREANHALEARSSAVQLASERVLAAKEAQKHREEEQAAAEQAVVEGQQALAEAQRHVRGFPAHLKQTTKRCNRAERKLQQFLTGPLAAYGKAFGAVSMPATTLIGAEIRETADNEDTVEDEEEEEEQLVEEDGLGD